MVKLKNTFRLTFRLHLLDLPGTFRDSVFLETVVKHLPVSPVKLKNTFRLTFRLHLPGLPGTFRDSVFSENMMENTFRFIFWKYLPDLPETFRDSVFSTIENVRCFRLGGTCTNH